MNYQKHLEAGVHKPPPPQKKTTAYPPEMVMTMTD